MWERIKNILQKEGGKCIIIENNEPAYVVLTFDEYEKRNSRPQPAVDEQLDQVNRNIAEWKELEAERVPAAPEPVAEENDTKIEDLPF